MNFFSWISSILTGKGSTNGKAEKPTVPLDSCTDPFHCPAVPEPPLISKDTSRIVLRKELEQSSNDLTHKNNLANEKLDEIDVLLTKRIEEKKGGVYGVC